MAVLDYGDVGLEDKPQKNSKNENLKNTRKTTKHQKKEIVRLDFHQKSALVTAEEGFLWRNSLT